MLLRWTPVLVLAACGGSLATDAETSPVVGSSADMLWPDGVVPYENRCFQKGDGFYAGNNCNDVVKQAITRWNATVDVVRFVPRGDHADYVVFQSGGGDCTTVVGGSPVGRRGGDQPIFAPACGSYEAIGVVLHEMAHAVGLHHAMQREDRGYYVSVDMKNVLAAEHENFVQMSGLDLGLYDPLSLMHYSTEDSKLFARDAKRPILTMADGAAIGRNSAKLRQSDLFALRALYAPDASPVISDVDVALSGRTADATRGRDVFGPSRKVMNKLCADGELCRVTDVNGDGFGDLVRLPSGVNDARGIWVAASDGGGFSAPTLWFDEAGFCGPSEQCELGDVDGDGRVDVIGFARRSLAQSFMVDPRPRRVRVAFQRDTGFEVQRDVLDEFCASYDEVCLVADLDGDRKVDLLSVNRTTGELSAARHPAPTFLVPGLAASACPSSALFCVSRYGHIDVPEAARDTALFDLARMNADPPVDLVVFERALGRVEIAFARDTRDATTAKLEGFEPLAVVHEDFCHAGDVCEVAQVSSAPGAELVAFEHVGERALRDAVDQKSRVEVAEAPLGWGAATLWGAEAVDTRTWHESFCFSAEQCVVGDVNGDGFGDAVAFDAR